MSIVPLEKVTFVGLTSQRERVLDDLHERGCLELIPLGEGSSPGDSIRPSSRSRDALKFLLSCPQRRKQVSDTSRFDAAEVETRTLEIQSQLQALETERDDLILCIEAIKPFGDFEFPTSKEIGGQKLWFYVVPVKAIQKLDGLDLLWEVVNRDPHFAYVVVVAPTEPTLMPVPRVHIGSRSYDQLQKRLEEVELAIEDAQAERAYLTRWCLVFARSLNSLENSAARLDAARQTYESEMLFAIQAWAPQAQTVELALYAESQGLVFESRPPLSGDNPPTLLHNERHLEAGEDLVNFYMTPGYWTWDPSGVVLISFALFFAMILADAGYALVLGLFMLLAWKKMGASEGGKRMRPMLAMIIAASLVYGVLVGSYFGLAPAVDSLPGRLHLLNMNNSNLMMGISILVGSIHVILANILNARRHVNWRDGLDSLGWAAAVGGGLLLGVGAAIPNLWILRTVGTALLLVGLVLVLLFTAPRETIGKRLLNGTLGLTKISSAFGDVLSYLRLFALGLASASLATAFNDMATGIRDSMPRFGLVLALLVLLFGHALNLLLGVSSGVIHGLRLNVIEFFNWGLKDEGRRFTYFRRKEDPTWR
jgi:V/A-type H+/Na+-transporting ATPase subunit I